MKKLLLAALLLASCSPSGEGNQQSSPSAAPKVPQSPAEDAPPKEGRLGKLTGLYEGGKSEPRNQMCVVEG